MVDTLRAGERMGVRMAHNRYIPFCMPCQWQATNHGFSDMEFAYTILCLHTQKQPHKVNFAKAKGWS